MQVTRYLEQFKQALVVERSRQEEKYGRENLMNSMDRYCTILGEEFGEVCRAAYEADPENLEEELIHVAAVAFAMYQRLQASKLAEGDEEKWQVTIEVQSPEDIQDMKVEKLK
jgi:NTP pyrophosphatase (non-canonical NTP hydrolase)